MPRRIVQKPGSQANRKPAVKGKPRMGVSGVENRRRMFVDAYFIHNQNASEAARSLGYAERSAGQLGWRILMEPETQAMIKARGQEMADKMSLTAEEVIRSLARALRFDPRLLYSKDGKLRPISELPDEIALELEGVEMDTKESRKHGTYNTAKIKFPTKSSARDQAMRYFGLFAKDKPGAGNLEDENIVPPSVAVTINFKDARKRK